MTALVAAALLILGLLGLTTALSKTILAIVCVVAGVLLLAGVVSSGTFRIRRGQ